MSKRSIRKRRHRGSQPLAFAREERARTVGVEVVLPGGRRLSVDLTRDATVKGVAERIAEALREGGT